MLGSPKKMRQNPSCSATCCIFDPGSVMATKRLPSRPDRSKKYCLKMLGSSVDPDLLETIKRVVFSWMRLSTSSNCAGSVESSTCSSGNPSCLPKESACTSGHKLDPPIPSSRIWVNPRSFISWANFSNLSAALSCASTISSQPSQLLSSPPVHSEASLDQSRASLPPARQSSSVRCNAEC